MAIAFGPEAWRVFQTLIDKVKHLALQGRWNVDRSLLRVRSSVVKDTKCIQTPNVFCNKQYIDLAGDSRTKLSILKVSQQKTS